MPAITDEIGRVLYHVISEVLTGDEWTSIQLETHQYRQTSGECLSLFMNTDVQSTIAKVMASAHNIKF